MFDDLRDSGPSDDSDIEESEGLFGDLDEVPESSASLAAPAFADDAFSGFEDDPLFVGEAATAGDDALVLGMTAQQRAVLSVFLFLDTSVLGCVFLLALGNIVP